MEGRLFIEHSIRLRLGFRAFETAPAGLNRTPKIVQMPSRTPKRDHRRSASNDLPTLPFPESDEESSSVVKINNWIALADIALGQSIRRKIA